MRTATAFAAALATAAFCPSANAGELVLFDGEVTHSKGFTYPSINEQPQNWTEPVDYADGTVHSRYILKTTASAKTISYQWCLFQGGSRHTCAATTRIAEVGTYYHSQPLKKMWTNFEVNWSGRFDRFMLVVKDKSGKPVDQRFGFGGKWDGAPNLDLYYPFVAHVTVVVVSSGSSFSGWDNYVPGMPGIRGRLFTMAQDARIKVYAQRGQLGHVWSAAEKLDTDEGRAIVGFLEEYVASREKEIRALKAREPDRAAEGLAELARLFQPSARSRELAAEARNWMREPATRQAVAAGKVLAELKKRAARLQDKLRGKKVTDPEVARKHGREVATITQYANFILKKYPGTISAERAASICASLGIDLP